MTRETAAIAAVSPLIPLAPSNWSQLLSPANNCSRLPSPTQKNKDLQENASASFEMPNEISTQQSNMAMTFHEGSTVNANFNQYGSLGYYNQPLPPYALQSHYSSPSMTYEGSASGNFQQLLHQQCNEDNNRRN
ncbi:hypothetical protein WN943_028562 [Citrus x changshan-huyou]